MLLLTERLIPWVIWVRIKLREWILCNWLWMRTSSKIKLLLLMRSLGLWQRLVLLRKEIWLLLFLLGKRVLHLLLLLSRIVIEHRIIIWFFMLSVFNCSICKTKQISKIVIFLRFFSQLAYQVKSVPTTFLLTWVTWLLVWTRSRITIHCRLIWGHSCSIHSWSHLVSIHVISWVHAWLLHARLLHARLLHTWLHSRLHSRLHTWMHTRLHPSLIHVGTLCTSISISLKLVWILLRIHSHVRHSLHYIIELGYGVVRLLNLLLLLLLNWCTKPRSHIRLLLLSRLLLTCKEIELVLLLSRLLDWLLHWSWTLSHDIKKINLGRLCSFGLWFWRCLWRWCLALLLMRMSLFLLFLSFVYMCRVNCWFAWWFRGDKRVRFLPLL